VLGREIPVRTTASPELVQKIETMVNERLALAATSMSLPNEQMVAILAMLNMAEEIVSLREHVQPDDHATVRLEKLLDLVSAQLVAGSR
jgi:cell division protein ZapA